MTIAIRIGRHLVLPVACLVSVAGAQETRRQETRKQVGSQLETLWEFQLGGIRG